MSSKKRIIKPEETTKVSLQMAIDYPLFCFKYLDEKVSIKKENDINFSFVKRASKLCQLGWKAIEVSDKHCLGFEYIKKNKLNIKRFPPIVTDEVDEFIVFRYSGNNRPFIGLRRHNIIHVLFIEAKFGDIYNHGTK